MLKFNNSLRKRFTALRETLPTGLLIYELRHIHLKYSFILNVISKETPLTIKLFTWSSPNFNDDNIELSMSKVGQTRYDVLSD